MENNSRPLIENIKLVIWDLDETFWKGTLSEEGIVIIPEHVEIVKQLTDRGIMNSICSKNNFEDTRKAMEELSIWDLFIFPEIAFIPKGPLVKKIIERAQLQPAHVLFIDDNSGNREEISYYLPGIQVMEPEQIRDLLNQPTLQGKLDLKRTRLQHYKNLELRAKDYEGYSSNEEFLIQSNIRVAINHNCEADLERIHEMVHRTNQLNYTKNRMARQELLELIRDSSVQTACVHVKDNYGDYGLVGFYAIQHQKCIHFLFSCRVLNIGVEQWLYAKLNYPSVTIEGQVATALQPAVFLSWIQEEQYVGTHQTSGAANDNAQLTCFLRGGCDLSQIAHYLKHAGYSIKTEFNYVSERGFNMHRDHTMILRQFFSLPQEKKEYLIEHIPFYDKKIFETKLNEINYDFFVYSVLMDYSLGIYRHKIDPELRIAVWDFNLPLTETSSWERIIEMQQGRITQSFLEWFADHFYFEGPYSEQEFRESLTWLLNQTPAHVPIIFLNGSEVEKEHEWEINRHLHHRSMNAVLESFAEQNERVQVVDVRNYVKNSSDVTNNIRHYLRETYKDISKDIIHCFETSKEAAGALIG
ncbi:HAD-IIIC family phosphatase [Paenibacillus sp. OV219]|uniref:HAD-IIIC family phosphatase n=1 Tax=Paenibacillus sp. OV219 TaxID=1884377 RepID=UPI0008BBCE77|nr:HAD-IIIC family phosphatase [Paenibacillus sp. OV219]SEP05143.1 HAD-superfamily phosphatase, subfamily IIIC/FkbH-like domain-containing protein [Paenibacillus sp. OV219]